MTSRTAAFALVLLAPLACTDAEAPPDALTTDSATTAHAALNARMADVDREIEALRVELERMADTSGVDSSPAVDSLEARASRLRVALNELATTVGDETRREADRMDARMDSLQRDLRVVRFREARQLELFESQAANGLAQANAAMLELEKRMEEAGDAVTTETRQRWAALRGELAELEAEAEAAAGVAGASEPAEFEAFRVDFAVSLAALEAELRRLSARLGEAAAAT